MIAPDYLISRINQVTIFFFASTDAVYRDSQDECRCTETDSLVHEIQKMTVKAIMANYGG